MMRNRYKTVGGTGWTHAQIQGDMYGHVTKPVGKIVIMLPEVQLGVPLLISFT